MKTYSTALFVTTIVFLAIVAAAFLFVGDGSINKVSTAQNSAVQDKGQEPKVNNQKAESQYTSTKNNSFSVGKILGEEQGNINPTKAMIHRGKMYLLKQVDNRVGQLGPFKVRIENMSTLNDSERQLLVSELIAEIAVFEALKSEISQSATREDIKNVAEKVKAEWIKSRLSVDRAKKQVIVSNENQLVSDADAVSLGMQKRIDALKAAGRNAKTYEKLHAAYNKKLASAKQDMESAKEKSSAAASAATDAEKQKLIDGNALLLTSSQDNIRDAYKLLMEGAREDFSQKYK